MDPDAWGNQYAKLKSVLRLRGGGFAPQTPSPLAGIVGSLTSCNLLPKPKTLKTKN